MNARTHIWPKVAPDLANRAISVHALIGVIVGGLLYILSLTGALLVFQDELGWWESPQAPAIAPLSPEAVEAAARAVVAADAQPTSDLVLYLSRPDLPRAVAATDTLSFSVDGAGLLVAPYRTPWTDFVTALHYHLHLPSTFGFVLVGILGAVMLGLIFTGLLSYPAIFRNAFALRRNGSPRTAETDLHNRLAVWTLPFQFAIAFSGAWIGLFVLVSALISQFDYDGDRGAVSDLVYGWSVPSDEAAAPFPGIAAAMRHMAREAPAATPTTLIVHDIGTAGQHMQVIALHDGEILLGEYYNFDGAGAFQGTVGLSDGAFGKQVAIAMYPIHFGRFGVTWTRIAYVLLGFVLCIIIATGLNLSLIKRQQQGRETRRLAAAWAALVWGAPAALAMSLLASVSGAAAGVGLIGVFWGGLALSLALSALRPNRGATTRILQATAAAALVAALAVQGAIHDGVRAAAPVLVLTTLFWAVALALGAAAFWSRPRRDLA